MSEPSYDPSKAPDAVWWLALDEDERLVLVEDHHRRAREKASHPRMHAVFHAIVETQVAAGDELPVARTLARLQDEGLDRHDAIHAIGSALAQCLHGLATTSAIDRDPNAAYAAALEALDARAWRAGNDRVAGHR